MPKSLKNILDGVKKSKIESGSTGKDPGVDYAPKSGDEQKFVAKHSVEKHDDRVGNEDDVYQGTDVKYSLDDQIKQKFYGHKKGEDKKVYEAAMCNGTPKGIPCPLHGLNECSSVNPKYLAEKPKKIKEDLAVPLLGGHDDTDEEIDMEKTELKALVNKAAHLLMNMPETMHIEPWIQAKIAVAKDNIGSIHDYLLYGRNHEHEEDEQTAPYNGGIDPSSGMVPSAYPNFSVDVNTGRNV